MQHGVMKQSFWALAWLTALLPPAPLEATEAADTSALPPGVERVEVFLLMGQSNMKGRGRIPKSQAGNPRILSMNLADDRWSVAAHPLHKAIALGEIDASDNAGVGPGLAFARELVTRNDATLIALVPLARGGSRIDLWDAERHLYKQTIRKAEEALADFPPGTARIAGALWFQGESDSLEARYAAYADKLAALVGKLRSDLNEPRLPFVACTIGAFIMPKGKYLRVKEINEALLALPGRVPRTACVDARDLPGHIGDFMHYDTESQVTIGKRFAAQYLQLLESRER